MTFPPFPRRWPRPVTGAVLYVLTSANKKFSGPKATAQMAPLIVLSESGIPDKNRYSPSLLAARLEGRCLFPVVGGQRYSPNVSRLSEFDPAVQRVLWIDINHPSRGSFIRQVDANRDSHPTTQPNRGCDQRSVKVDHDGLALACPDLSVPPSMAITTFRGTRVLRRDSRNVAVEGMSDKGTCGA